MIEPPGPSPRRMDRRVKVTGRAIAALERIENGAGLWPSLVFHRAGPIVWTVPTATIDETEPRLRTVGATPSQVMKEVLAVVERRGHR